MQAHTVCLGGMRNGPASLQHLSHSVLKRNNLQQQRFSTEHDPTPNNIVLLCCIYCACICWQLQQPSSISPE
jgi:hypothetical protein